MAGFRRFPIVKTALGLLALALALGGCVGEYTPQEAAARTATVSAYKVPTRTPDLSTKAPPTVAPSPEASPTPNPQPTEANTPTPAAAAPTESLAADLPVANLPVGTQAGQQPPDFTLRDAAGQEINLSGLRGQPVAIIFWASWCPHCQKEMPLMQDMYEQYADQGLAVVGVSVPGLGGETKEKALAFIAKEGITFPVLFDGGGQVYTQYQVRGVPNLIFIDRDGAIVANVSGAMEADRLEMQIRQIVEEG